MRILIAMMFLVLFSGCAIQPISKQSFVGKMKSGDLANEVLSEMPQFTYCFGWDRLTAWRALDNSYDKAIDSVASYIPDIITSKDQLEAYGEDIGMKTTEIFFRDNSRFFSLDGLSVEQAQSCLAWTDGGRLLVQEVTKTDISL